MEQAFPRLVMPKEGSLPPRPPHLIAVVKGLFLIFAHSFGVEHENIYIKVWQGGGTRRFNFFVQNTLSSI